MDLILASQSPRRKQLLEQLGLNFRIKVSSVDETTKSDDITEIVKQLAISKAKSVAADFPDAVVLGADTLVTLDGQLLGKPAHRTQARAMLERLNGSTHHVLTGVALLQGCTGKLLADSVITKVKFRRLNEQEISAYLDTGEYMDKAGGYGIQGVGAVLVEKIEGCYFNVVGLPLTKTAEMLAEMGIYVLGEKNCDQGNGGGLSPHH